MYFTSFSVHSIFLQEISQYFGNQVLRRQFETLIFTENGIGVYFHEVVLNGNTFNFTLKELQASWLTLCENKSIAISTGKNYVKT